MTIFTTTVAMVIIPHRPRTLVPALRRRDTHTVAVADFLPMTVIPAAPETGHTHNPRAHSGSVTPQHFTPMITPTETLHTD